MENGRILHLIDTGGPGGAETVFFDLVGGLSERGWESVAVVPEIDWLHGRLVAADRRPLVLPCDRAFDVRYVLALRDLIRSRRIDLVQAHLFGSGAYGALACLGTHVPVVCTLHGRPDIPRDARFRRVKSRLLRRKRNRVICVSDSLRRHFIHSEDLDEDALVISNGVDLNALDKARPAGLRSELGLDPDTPLIGAVGNIRPSKAYGVLIAAFAGVRERLPGTHLVVAGHYAADEEAYIDLVSQCKSLGVHDSIHFLGFRADAIDVMRDLDVFVLSSSDEGFSLATVQALALGVPAVVTRSGGPEEIVGDSGAALLVAPDSPLELTQGLISVLSNDLEQARLVKQAAAKVARQFSLPRMLDQYESLYRSLVNC